MPKISPTYKMPFKRRRLGKTDYQQRLQLLTSQKPRLVVRKSLNYISAQIVQFDLKGDKTLLSANSRALKKLGWNFSCDNLPAAYLTGLALGKIAKQNKMEEEIGKVQLKLCAIHLTIPDKEKALSYCSLPPSWAARLRRQAAGKRLTPRTAAPRISLSRTAIL